jgi:RNA polymerase sigma factor (sigma-70 family)
MPSEVRAQAIRRAKGVIGAVSGPGDKKGGRGSKDKGGGPAPPESSRDPGRYRSALDSHLRDIRRYPLLTQSGEFDVARNARQGLPGARNELVQANLRLVVKIASEYRHAQIGLEELIAEGEIGLIQAANRFDPARGVRFVSYASWWIRKYMYLAVHRQSLQTTSPAGGTERTDTPSTGRAARRGARPKRQRILSFDAFLVEAGDRNFLEKFVGASPDDPQKIVLGRDLAGALRAVLPRLPAQDARVLSAHYGLDGDPPRTLQQIGRLLGLTRERVRQIELRALDRARRLLGTRPRRRPAERDRGD